VQAGNRKISKIFENNFFLQKALYFRQFITFSVASLAGVDISGGSCGVAVPKTRRWITARDL
jgi:hypothetical protein